MNTKSPKPAPLRAPDVARMEELERALAADMARTAELWATVEAARAPWLEAEDHLDHYDLEANPDPALWRQLRAEVERTRTASRAAQDAWRAAEAPEHARRVEWLQLQVVRGFLPRCAMCERIVGPVYLELGRDRQPPALCLDCFDSWACEYDPTPDRQPPSHWLQLTAQEARELETARRQEQPEPPTLRVLRPDEVPAEPAPDRPCWHCGGPVDDLGDMESTYAMAPAYPGRGAAPPRVVLKVAALVPEGTQPEVGEVCLLCLDKDLELFGRWAEIEHNLCDPGRRQLERALHHFVQEGTAR
jgi:hypothetical protein